MSERFLIGVFPEGVGAEDGVLIDWSKEPTVQSSVRRTERLVRQRSDLLIVCV